MKHYTQYINEALDSEIQKFLKGIYDVEIALFKSGKLQDIEIKQGTDIKQNEINELKRIKNPFEFKNYSTDKVLLSIINDKNIGFPETSKILKGKNTLLPENSAPFMYAYWKNTEDNITYFIGLCMYDINKSLKDDYLTIINIETVSFIKDEFGLAKTILGQFIKDIENLNKNYEGLVVKPIDAKHKTFFNKLGFVNDKEDKNLMIYNI